MNIEMQLTFASIISIVVFTLCFAVILIIALKNNERLSSVKYELLLVCLAAPIMRLVIPVEVLPWTHNINLPFGLPRLTELLHRTIMIQDTPVTIWRIIFGICTMISIIIVIGVFVAYGANVRVINAFPEVEDPKYQEMIGRILLKEGKKNKFTVRWVPSTESPFVVGIFNPTILMPKVELSEDELECVLRHEIAHYLYGDLLIRFGWVIIKAICWWNPAVYLLDGQLGKLLEVRADENATKKLTDEQLDKHLDAMVSLGKEKGPLLGGSTGFGAAFMEKKGFSIANRVKVILNRAEVSRKGFWITNFILVLIVLVLTVAMNCLIVELYSAPEGFQEATGTEVTGNNSFFIINEEGTYDIYLDGKYCMTVEDNLGSDIPVYKSLEEAMKYEEIE